MLRIWDVILKSLIAMFLAFALVSNASAPSSVLAAPKRNPTANAPTKINKAVPLTNGECTKLGGSISENVTCNSGSMCTTTDESGNSHHVCISARK